MNFTNSMNLLLTKLRKIHFTDTDIFVLIRDTITAQVEKYA